MPQLHLTTTPRSFHILVEISALLSILVQNPPKALAKSELARRQRRAPSLVEARLSHVISDPAPNMELQDDHELHASSLARSSEDFGHAVAAVCVDASLVADACGRDRPHEAYDELLIAARVFCEGA